MFYYSRGTQVCPGQDLMCVTYPVTDSSARTTHTEVAITQPGVIQYTVYDRKGCHSASDIMIVAHIMTVLFSKWQLPSC